MKAKELKNIIEQIEDDMEIYIRYGHEQVSDVEIIPVPFDGSWNIDNEDSYLICSNGKNIKNVNEL